MIIEHNIRTIQKRHRIKGDVHVHRLQKWSKGKPVAKKQNEKKTTPAMLKKGHTAISTVP